MPEDTTNWIRAMYHDTKTCTRINNKISPLAQTHNGLQQGALSSPILFNYFINDLIEELNRQDIGAQIGTKVINNLLFADDILLVAHTPRQLQKLLNICSNWANKWKLNFSQSKSKLLTTESHTLRPMKLQGGKIYDIVYKSYTYLGLPINKTGIDTKSYFKTVRTKFWASLQEILTFSEQKQYTNKQRIALYKSAVRSQLDYALAILPYTQEEIEKLDDDQIRAIKKLTKIDYNTDRDTVLSIFDIPSIPHRIIQMKATFYLKTQKHKNQSLAHTVMNELIQNPQMRTTDRLRQPPTLYTQNMLKKYDMYHLLSLNNDSE